MLKNWKKFGAAEEITTHAALTTTVHGAGANTILYSNHNALLTGVHGTVRVKKDAITTVNNSTVLVNATGLVFAVGANEVWAFTLLLLTHAGATLDFKFAWSIPAGCSGYHSYSGTRNASALTTALVPTGYAQNEIWEFVGIVVNGATAGNVQFQFAQNVATAVDTSVLPNSVLIAERVA